LSSKLEKEGFREGSNCAQTLALQKAFDRNYVQGIRLGKEIGLNFGLLCGINSLLKYHKPEKETAESCIENDLKRLNSKIESLLCEENEMEIDIHANLQSITKGLAKLQNTLSPNKSNYSVGL